jgi:RimJ/RimL family protein N-acetyltransferase
VSPAPQDLDQLVVVEAGRFRIRYKHACDFRDDYRWRCDPEIARFDGRSPLALPFEAFERQAEYEARTASPARESFSIVDAAGVHVGNVMFYNATSEAAELGVVLAEEAARGQGAGRAVMTAFVRYLWSAHAFRRLVLHTLEWNERALRCFRACGFEETARVLREEGWLVRMEARREWWLLWDAEGRFATPEEAST